MRAHSLRISLILILLGTASISLAKQTPGEIWLSGYSKYMEGLEVEKAGNDIMALKLFQEAAADMKKVKAEYPDWKSDVVTFRLERCNRKIDVLSSAVAERQSEMSKAELLTLNQNLKAQVSDLEQQVAAALEKVEAAKALTPVVPAEPVEPVVEVTPQPVAADDKKVANLQEKNDDLEAKINELDDQVDVLKDEISARDKALKAANNEIAKGRKLEKEISKLQKTAAALEEDLINMAKQKSAIRAEVDQLRREREDMADKLEDLEKEVKDLQADSASLRARNDALRKQVK